MYALAYEVAKSDGWIALPEPSGATHEELRATLPPMPDGQDTKSMFLINEMSMKACRSGDIQSLQLAVNAAREQGMSNSLISKATAGVLKEQLRKRQVWKIKLWKRGFLKRNNLKKDNSEQEQFEKG